MFLYLPACRGVVTALSCICKEFPLKPKTVLIAGGREKLTDRIKHQVTALFKKLGLFWPFKLFKQLCPALTKVNWQAGKATSCLLLPNTNTVRSSTSMSKIKYYYVKELSIGIC